MFNRLKMRPRKKDLNPTPLERLLTRFPDMNSHVHEVSWQYSYGRIDRTRWPILPPLPALRRISISNVYHSQINPIIDLLAAPSLVHFELRAVRGLPLTEIIAALPAGLKTLALEQVEAVGGGDFEDGLNLHRFTGPIHLECLTVEGYTDVDTSVLSFLLDPRSRIVLSNTRRLVLVSRDSMGLQACNVLQECQPSLQHLEFRFPRDRSSDNLTFLPEPITAPFPRLSTLSFLFSSRDACAPTAHAADILADLTAPLLEEVTIRFNLHLSSSVDWCDTALPAVDLALSQISSLVNVAIVFRILNRGKHSVAEQSALILSSMPRTYARNILRIDRVFPY
ncbi:hypothetical protein C8R43DRAFT_1012178 [Mycena crocata]|nr:hypothetical protein C8R43DRAFT_1012178 [Mycena crocata]